MLKKRASPQTAHLQIAQSLTHPKFAKELFFAIALYRYADRLYLKK